jgi:lysophospholipase L1-like esterase
MTTSRSILVLLTATALVGCSNASEPNTSGSGGSAGQGSGGSSTGNGGASATGGKTTGSGGTTSGSGGAGKGGSGSGGAVGSGGASSGGQGGTARNGGATGSGGGTGQAGSGGGTPAGGAIGAGGAATGGTTGAGGAVGSGGAVSAGGAIGAGGAVGSGGASPAGGATGTGGSGSGGATGDQHWVGTWTASPYYDSGNQPPKSLANSVLRQVVRVSLGGSQLRVQFSNLGGNGSVTISAAHIALCKASPAVDSTIDAATDTALAFGGSASVTIAQGKEVWSDPVDFTVPNQGNISITTSFGSVPSQVVGHSGSRTTSYLVAGSTALNAASMTSGATTFEHWYYISGIDVMADASAAGVVAIGDSITDGRGTDNNKNNRWTDIMAARLQANAATAKIATMNQGIGATNLVGTSGTAAQARFNRDVLGQSGVKYVIVFDGVNDIGSSGLSFNSLKSAYDDLIKRAHDKGLKVFGGTILPFGGNSYYTTSHESVRTQVNDYIKSGVFDGVIDFDAALTDGGNPPKLQAAYEAWTPNNPQGSADWLHPGPAGYQKMGETVDLALFK